MIITDITRRRSGNRLDADLSCEVRRRTMPGSVYIFCLALLVLMPVVESHAGGTGTVDKVSGWYEAGSNLTVTATPAKFSVFQAWTGDTNLCVQNGNIINIPIDGYRCVSAVFVLKKTPKGTTESWLEAYDLTNGTPEEIELADYDGDGAFNWQEYIAGTDPTNRNDYFGINISYSNGVPVIYFVTKDATSEYYGSLLRWYALECINDFSNTNWLHMPGYTNMPSSVNSVRYTNSVQTNRVFYRARTWLE